jgi:DNA-binding HxlR family transcriptional regulator
VEQTEPEGTHWVRTTLNVLGGKWKILILWHLRKGAKRYSALRRSIPEISEKMLISQLKELEKDEIVRRTVLRSVPPQVEYAFTPHGDTLLPVLEALCAWGEYHEKQLLSSCD